MKFKDFKEQKEKEFNEFGNKYMFFAYSDKQFDEGMEKLGLKPEDIDKIYNMDYGGFMLKTASSKFDELVKKYDNLFNENLFNDSFLYDLFYYTLDNHEYIITYSLSDVLYYSNIVSKLYDFGLDEDVKECNEELKKYSNLSQIMEQLEKARQDYLKDYEEYN